MVECVVLLSASGRPACIREGREGTLSSGAQVVYVACRVQPIIEVDMVLALWCTTAPQSWRP